jgi:hypothetical protein
MISPSRMVDEDAIVTESSLSRLSTGVVDQFQRRKHLLKNLYTPIEWEGFRPCNQLH